MEGSKEEFRTAPLKRFRAPRRLARHQSPVQLTEAPAGAAAAIRCALLRERAPSPRDGASGPRPSTMAAVRAEPGSRPAGGARFFCTAGRGLEPFLMREVRARLAATQVSRRRAACPLPARGPVPAGAGPRPRELGPIPDAPSGTGESAAGSRAARAVSHRQSAVVISRILLQQI